MNRGWMQRNKVGPDGFLQLSLQLASYRLTGKIFIFQMAKVLTRTIGHPVSVYESASTSMFKDGRTETIRPCTKEVIEVAKMLDTVSL